MPCILGTNFQERVSIHFEHCLILMESAQRYDSLLRHFWLESDISSLMFNLRISLLDPFKQILFVSDKLEDTSIFTQILKVLIALSTLLLFFWLFYFTARLTDGMLVFTNHYWSSVMFIEGVLANYTWEGCVIHADQVVDCKLLIWFVAREGLPEFSRDFTEQGHDFTVLVCWDIYFFIRVTFLVFKR